MRIIVFSLISQVVEYWKVFPLIQVFCNSYHSCCLSTTIVIARKAY